MYPILFELGPITIYSYGFFIGIGILVALLLSIHRGKKLGFSSDVILDLCIYGVLGGFIGAKLLFWIVEFPNILKNPSYIVETLSSGFVVYGGIIVGILTGYVYCKIKKLDFLMHLDFIIPMIALAQGFGRIGCFSTGCCYGKETHSALGVIFENSLSAPNGVSLIPTQLFSSVGDFFIAAFLLYYSSKSKIKGQVTGLYMILYSMGRFIIEMFRDDPRGNVGILSTSQFICIAIFFCGILCIYFSNKQSSVKK